MCTAGGTHGATLTILDQGICLVHADQAGNATHRAAPRQSLPVQIGIGALVQDGGFEAGPATPWVQGSTNFGTPLCDASCGLAWAVPHDGSFWVRFGGAINAHETGFVQQTGTIAVGSKWLDFQLWWPTSSASAPAPNEVLDVLIDGTPIFSLTQETATDYVAGYTQVSVDISAYADGNAHTLRFDSSAAPSGEGSAIFVDDVGIRMVTDGAFLD